MALDLRASLSAQPPAKKQMGWQKGQSGNPGGKPKCINLQALARAHTEEAIKTLVVAMKHPRERVAAASILLDRGWGKPKQEIESTSITTNVNLHLIAAQILGEQLALEQQHAPRLTLQEQAVLDDATPTE